MITESAPWKDQLLRDAGRLQRIATTKLDLQNGVGVDKALVEQERIIFVSAYAMRKLWESGKLSSKWPRNRIDCGRFPIKGTVPDRLNWDRINDHYDLDAGQGVSMPADEFCGRIIHSFIFLPVMGISGCPDAFYFTSDKTRSKAVWMTGVKEVVQLMRITGRDYPSSGIFQRRHDGEILTWAGHGEPPKRIG